MSNPQDTRPLEGGEPVQHIPPHNTTWASARGAPSNPGDVAALNPQPIPPGTSLHPADAAPLDPREFPPGPPTRSRGSGRRVIIFVGGSLALVGLLVAGILSVGVFRTSRVSRPGATGVAAQQGAVPTEADFSDPTATIAPTQTLAPQPTPTTAPPPASAQIASPATGTTYDVGYSGATYAVTLVAHGSSGMQFTWTDNINGALGGGPSITVNLDVQQQGNCMPATVHVVTLHGRDGLGRSAAASITINLKPYCSH
jgi:hypothetical protein